MVKAVIFDYGGVLRRRLVLQKQLIELASELQGQQIRTAILSNMYRPIASVFRNRPEFKHFEPVIISCDVGTRKPDQAIYQLMLEKLRLTAQECIFIDNRSDNITAAKQLGFQTIHATSTKTVIEQCRALLSKQT